jgi:hypothetical protein
VTIERFMLARVVAAAVVPRSAAESPGTFVVGWRPPPWEQGNGHGPSETIRSAVAARPADLYPLDAAMLDRYRESECMNRGRGIHTRAS